MVAHGIIRLVLRTLLGGTGRPPHAGPPPADRETPPVLHPMTDDEFDRKLKDGMDTVGPACSCLVTIVLAVLLMLFFLRRCG